MIFGILRHCQVRSVTPSDIFQTANIENKAVATAIQAVAVTTQLLKNV